MLKKYALLMVLVISHSAFGISVGGIINANTVWDNTSEPYYVDSTVQIAPTVSLTIAEGVQIIGGNDIQVFGTLNISGSKNNPVELNNVNVCPGANATSRENPFQINVNYANFNGGSLYSPTGKAIYGSLTLRNSLLENTKYMHLHYPESDAYIEKNVFRNSGGISVGLIGGVNAYIKNNLFIEQNGYGSSGNSSNPKFAVQNWASYGDSECVVEYNSFDSIDRTALILPSGYSNAAMIGINNWWNTTDISQINAMVYDRNDDLSCAGYIPVAPFLTAPHSETPIPEPTTMSMLSLAGIFLLRKRRAS